MQPHPVAQARPMSIVRPMLTTTGHSPTRRSAHGSTHAFTFCRNPDKLQQCKAAINRKIASARAVISLPRPAVHVGHIREPATRTAPGQPNRAAT